MSKAEIFTLSVYATLNKDGTSGIESQLDINPEFTEEVGYTLDEIKAKSSDKMNDLVIAMVHTLVN